MSARLEVSFLSRDARRRSGLGCWARADDLPSWISTSNPWSTACGAEPASDLGLCAHHLLTIFPEARSYAPRP
jgi:hypothetical protein